MFFGNPDNKDSAYSKYEFVEQTIQAFIMLIYLGAILASFIIISLFVLSSYLVWKYLF